MAEHPFRKFLAKELFPVLRAEGFKGSGTTLRRTAKPLIHVFNIQAGTNLYANCCFINLGLHIESLQMPGGGPLVSAERIMEYECFTRAYRSAGRARELALP